jgi:NADH-quinone oxidoreductase subunit E
MTIIFKEVNVPLQSIEQTLEGRRSQPNQLIEVLQDIQKEYGYISKEAMETVSRGLGVPLIEVYRVACF